MKRLPCRLCGTALNNQEIALNLRLRGRALSTFFCLPCLAGRYGVTTEQLMEQIQFYQSNGCELFAVRYVDEPQ